MNATILKEIERLRGLTVNGLREKYRAVARIPAQGTKPTSTAASPGGSRPMPRVICRNGRGAARCARSCSRAVEAEIAGECLGECRVAPAAPTSP